MVYLRSVDAVEISCKRRMVDLVEHSHRDLAVGFERRQRRLQGEMALEVFERERGVRYEMSSEQGQDGWRRDEGFHEDGREFDKVGGASGPGHVVVFRSSEHGWKIALATLTKLSPERLTMNGMTHLVKQGLHLLPRQQTRPVLKARPSKVGRQDHKR